VAVVMGGQAPVTPGSAEYTLPPVTTEAAALKDGSDGVE